MGLALHEALSKVEYRTIGELAQLMGRSVRDAQATIEHARKTSRLPIMSGPDGYRLAGNPEEYAFNVQRRRKRALVQLVTVGGELEYIRQWRERLHPSPPTPPAPAQEELWGGSQQ